MGDVAHLGTRAANRLEFHALAADYKWATPRAVHVLRQAREIVYQAARANKSTRHLVDF